MNRAGPAPEHSRWTEIVLVVWIFVVCVLYFRQFADLAREVLSRLVGAFLGPI